ncbi:MAG TPA: hypothetical protein VG348_15775 [Acidimicrobiia bacterium]|jgi:hypothetical protein|nr:hypothetical protein [Acidimicrobiia bacterium]
MAVAISNVKPIVSLPGVKLATCTVTLDTSYPTGGTVGITAALEAAGLPIDSGIIAFAALQSAGYDYDYLPATDALKVWGGAAAGAGVGVEVANATNLSAKSIVVLVVYE